jgi:hypothetical protein
VPAPSDERFDGKGMSAALFGQSINRKKDLFWSTAAPEFIYLGRAEDRSPNLAMGAETVKLL